MVRLVPSSGPRAWRRLSRSVRQVLATSLAPVLTAGGLALPSAAMTAVAVAGVTAAVAASAVATAPAAQAAAPTGNGKALVLLQSGSTAPEKTVLTAAGWSVDQETPATWKTGSWTWNGSTVSFSDFAVLVIGDPSTTSSCSTLLQSTTTLGTAWQSAVSGNVAVAGTAPAVAGTTAANALVTDAAAYAGSGSGTGLYMSLNCQYNTAAANTRVSLLDGVAGIGAAGGLTVQGGLACTDPGSVNKWQAAAARTFDGFTSDSLGTSSWPSPGCPVQEAFDSWPAMFTPVAYDAAADAADNFTASNGLTGQPYILLGAPVSSAALVQSTGGMTPMGTTVHGGNPVAPGVQHATAGNGVDTENGDFSLSATDLSIPGFGPALDFTRTYDAQQAQQQTVAGSPGPMGYGWTDNWATSEVPHRPLPGDIYAVNAVGASVLNPDDVVPDAAGDLFVADTGRSRVLEVAAADSTQFGIAMAAGHGYTVAGSSTGASGNSGIGGVATSALMSGPHSVAVDPAGNLYIADTGNNQLQEVPAATGTQWGQSMTAGHLYTIAGSTAGTAGFTGYNGPAASAKLSMPVSVRLDGQGNVYIGDQGNARVLEIAATTGTKRGQSMTAGSLYVIAGSATGSSGYAGNGGPATSALMNTVGGIALDQAGNLFISESWFNVVREVPVATGKQFGHTFTANDIYTIAGDSSHAGMTGTTSGDNGPAIGSGLREPAGVALDSSGDLYIADTYNNRIQEVAAASGTQWGKSMTLGNIYTVLGQANGTSGTAGDGGTAGAAFLDLPTSVSLDSPGDLLVPDNFNSKLREVFASSSTQVFNTTPTGTGWSIIQGDGSWVNFYPKVSGTCQAPYVAYPGSGACTLPQNVGVSLNQDPTTHIFNYRPDPGAIYTYDSSGVLQSIKDAAGDTLTVATGTPGSGNNCPTTAATCQVITAASGRALSVGLASNGLVTTVTDPMSRRWTYAYNPALQLAAAYDPMGHRTSYTYGAGSTGNPQLANAMLTITTPNAQAGGPDAGMASVNVYDSLGRVTSQTDPMGNQTTINYCVSSASSDCLNAATGSGFVAVTDSDSNNMVYQYTQGTEAARTSYTGTVAPANLTSETDRQPDTTTGTLLSTSSTDGNNHTTTSTIDGLGNTTTTVAPAITATGTATTTSGYAESVYDTETLPNCTTSSQATLACSADSPPVPVTHGGTIIPPSSPPPLGTTYTLYDTEGNALYSTMGVYEPGASSAAYSQTTYQLFNGNSVTLAGASTVISCAATAPSPSLPCATVNADGVVTQLTYNSVGDLISSATPDGNGSEIATTSYIYDGDGEQASTTSPDGNLPTANPGNYTTVTAYDADGRQTSVSVAGGSGATVAARVTSHAYDADGNQVTETDPRGYVTTTAYNADNQAVTVTDPDGDMTLTCYDGDGNTVQTVPAVGVASNSLTAASCPTSYPAGYGIRLATDATVTTFDSDGNQTQQTTPAPAGQSGYETATFTHDGDGNVLQATAPPVSNGGPNVITVSTYTPAGQLASTTVGYGTSAASTTTYCYDPAGNRTAVVMPDGNTSGVANCETSSPWVVSASSHPTQASYQATYSYDSAGKQVSTTTPATSADPSGGTTIITYDPAGNKLTSTDPSGVTTTWTYAPAGKPATVTYSGSSAHSVAYTYDADGQRTSMADATGTSTYVYDPYGEISSETNGAGQAAGYAYDAVGDVTGITYPLPASATWPTSPTVTYLYDHARRLTDVTDFDGNQIAITDNADGDPATEALGATGDTITTGYDNTGSPSSMTLRSPSSTLQSFTYADAPSSGVLTETDTPASAQSPATYTYDGQGRVASMTPGTGSQNNYALDPSGNLTTLPPGASGTYDKSGELTNSTLSGTATAYAYSQDGQRVSATQGTTTTASAAWNGAGELTAYATPAASMTSATYNGNGLRATASGGTVTQSFVWGDLGSQPGVLMDSTNAYVYGDSGTPAEQVNLSTGAISYLSTDRIGSVRGIIGSTGSITAATAYDAWGNPESAGGLTSYTPFGFAGGYTDRTGLIYLVARYYDPATGQFMSVDPEVAQTAEPYAYANGDPIINSDPTGAWTDGPKQVGEAIHERADGTATTWQMTLQVNAFNLLGQGLDWYKLTVTIDPGAVTSRVGWRTQRKAGGSRLGKFHFKVTTECAGKYFQDCGSSNDTILPSGNSSSTKNTFTVPTAARTRSKFSHMVDFRSKCSSCVNDSSSDNIIYASTALAYREATGNACYYRKVLQGVVSMGERTGLGLVEVTILDALDVVARESGGRPFKSAKVVSMVEERIGLAPGYAYEILIDLALPWKVPVMLVSKGGNFGSRDGFPPMGFHDTEAGLSPAGEVALAAERGEIAPVPIGLINGNAYRDGTRPPFRPQGIIDAIREVIRRPRVADDEITAIVGLPDFLTGCEVTGDLAALASGETVELALRARITMDEGKRQLLVQDIPPSVDISWAYGNVSNQAGLYAEAKEDPGGNWAPGLPMEDVEPFFSHDSDLFICTAAPGVSLEWLRDQVAQIDGVVTTMKAALPRPLPDMVRQWVAAHESEDQLASLAALEEAINHQT